MREKIKKRVCMTKEQLSKEAKQVRKEVIEKIATLLTAAFGFVAALAWNEAIKSLFAQVFGDQSGIMALFVYAIIVTVIAVIATVWIGKISEKSK